MFCNKCGRYTETDDNLCPECQAQVQTPVVVQVEEQVVAPIQPTKAKNGAGIVAMIVSFVGAILVIVAAGLLVAAVELLAEGYSYMDIAGLATIGSVAQFVSLPFLVVTLIFGIFAIKNFVKANKAGTKKPLPGFIMGLIGLGTMTLSATYVIENFSTMLYLFG